MSAENEWYVADGGNTVGPMTHAELVAALGRYQGPATMVFGPSTGDWVQAKNVPAMFGEFLFGYVKEDYRRPNADKAIQVTAKWTCTPGDTSNLEELKYWWQRVGTDAYSMEEGLLRFETYQVLGEDALIIHETFSSSDELKFHLTKGTAERYKKDIDRIAAPEAYFFRGPVAWTIRTYSKFMHLPATYSSQGSNFTRSGGSMSDGVTA